jgi:uncharacterized membrane protein YbhN (UPF0104 family)
VQGLGGAASSVRARDLIGPTFIGFLANALLPGRAGEPARVLLASRRLRRRGVPLGVAPLAGTAVAEVLLSSATWALLALGALVALPLPSYVALGAGAALGVCTVAVVLAFAFREGDRPPPVPSGSLFRRASRGTRTALVSAASGLRGLRQGRISGPAISASVLAWILQWLAVYWVMIALHLEEGLGAAAAVLVTTTVAQVVPIVPGNLGSFQAAAAFPLVASYGVAGADALALGVALHAVQALVAVGPGLVFLASEDLDLRRLASLWPRHDAPGTGAIEVRPARESTGSS